MKQTLRELYLSRSFRTDKDDGCHRFRGRSYLDVYDQLLSGMRDREFTLVELGVLVGGSLQMWKEYFPRAKIVGVDIDPAARQHVPEGVTFVGASQCDEGALINALSSLPPLGVVIDDASHYLPHMLASFRFLWPLVMDDGVYVMEDTAITYHAVDPTWPGMAHNPQPFAANRREELDALTLQLIRDMDHLKGDVRSIEFHPMMIAIRKAQRWTTPELSRAQP